MMPTWKAALDLVALLLIWAGTAAITFGGVPALVGNPVIFNGQQTTFNGQPLIFGHTPESKDTLRRYWAWAVPGFVALTVGALWQALGPASVLLPSAHLLDPFR